MKKIYFSVALLSQTTFLFSQKMSQSWSLLLLLRHTSQHWCESTINTGAKAPSTLLPLAAITPQQRPMVVDTSFTGSTLVAPRGDSVTRSSLWHLPWEDHHCDCTTSDLPTICRTTLPLSSRYTTNKHKHKHSPNYFLNSPQHIEKAPTSPAWLWRTTYDRQHTAAQPRVST